MHFKTLFTIIGANIETFFHILINKNLKKVKITNFMLSLEI